MGLPQMIKSLFLSRSGGTLGTMVFRPTNACPTGGWETIFTVAIGNVLMTLLLGERTEIQGGGASNIDFQVVPTGAAAVSLCAVTVCTIDAVGTFYTITGNPADACYSGLAVPGGMAGGALLTGQNTHGWVIPPGTVQWRESAGTGTGSVQFYMFYVPIDRRANVVAAA